MDNRAVSVDHYENFPVASWLCPPRWRPAVVAIYRFARTADDIADEGDASRFERRALLERYEQALRGCAAGHAVAEWPEVFGPLGRQIEAHALPVPLLADLLSAFKQDTDNPIYADRAGLLDYCTRSANPVGRLLLHLANVRDVEALAQSDAICTALQLVNFWQDLSIDLPRRRCYVPEADARRHGVHISALRSDTDATRALVRELVAWAREMMLQGAPLVHRLQGRFGWELRLVVQGGLRVLEKIEAHGCNALSHRPTVGAIDAPLLVWRALWMRHSAQSAPLAGPAAR